MSDHWAKLTDIASAIAVGGGVDRDDAEALREIRGRLAKLEEFTQLIMRGADASEGIPVSPISEWALNAETDAYEMTAFWNVKDGDRVRQLLEELKGE